MILNYSYLNPNSAPLDPLLGLCPGPDGDLKRSPDPSPTHAPPNPKSWIRPCQLPYDHGPRLVGLMLVRAPVSDQRLLMLFAVSPLSMQH
jgi:hypothetical protein